MLLEYVVALLLEELAVTELLLPGSWPRASVIPAAAGEAVAHDHGHGRQPRSSDHRSHWTLARASRSAARTATGEASEYLGARRIPENSATSFLSAWRTETMATQAKSSSAASHTASSTS